MATMMRSPCAGSSCCAPRPQASGLVRIGLPHLTPTSLRQCQQARRAEALSVMAEPEQPSKSAAAGLELENPESEASKKKAEADRLRAAEKFLVIGAGSATCEGCGFEYLPEKGDPEFPVPKGTNFQDLPADYYCPICGAPKDRFKSKLKVVAGFAENQKYGLGTNSMTSNQKLLLIYGALALFFLLFLGGYALE